MKKTATFILFVLLTISSFAQPANDEPCNATLLPIIESVDGCTPILYNITGATFSNVPGTLSCNNSPDVWFRFNTPNPFMKIRFGGSNVIFTVYTYTSCSSNLVEGFSCFDSSNWASSNSNFGFIDNTNQLIRVQSANGSANFSFSICLTLLRAGADQRVGINTKFPQANLDVAGKAVFRDTLSVSNVFRLNNGTQGNNRILRSDANGYAFWGDAPANYWTANGVNIYNSNSGNVGIGTNTPAFPLSFANTLGNKIGFFGFPSSNYGIGLQDYLLQMYANDATSNIAFGYGSSTNFTERMRIINNGADGMSLNGRILLRNGSSPLNLADGPGIWLSRADNTGLLGFMGAQNNQNIGFFGGPGGWGFTYNAINSRVGIGNNNPNAPLSFAPSLGKKITLYPGATGDVGFGVAGNRLQIYTDNPNADVAIGYDAAGVFNERFAVKANGAISVSGNAGVSKQVLQSNGNGSAPSWVTQPYIQSLKVPAGQATELNGSVNLVTIPSLNNQLLTVPVASRVQFTLCATILPLGITGTCSAIFRITLYNSANNAYVGRIDAEGYAGNTDATTVYAADVFDLPAGVYRLEATHWRNSGGDSGPSLQYNQKVLIQVFPN